MVDINLMGEEEDREESQPDEHFAKTVNLDLGDTADEEKISPFSSSTLPGSYSRESMGSSFGRKPSPSPRSSSGSSRTKAYLLLAALILSALVAVFFIIPRVGKMPFGSRESAKTTLPPQEEFLESEADTLLAEVEPPGIEKKVPELTPSSETLPTLSPAERELVGPTRLGAYTIGALGQSFSGDNDFTLITFYGNNRFMVEFLASSSAAINEVTQAMKRSASPEEIRTVSQSEITGNGRSLNKVLVSGSVSEKAALFSFRGGLKRMNFTEFSVWLKKLASDNTLGVKQFEVGSARLDDGSSHTPVRANFSGPKESVFNFLKNMADAGPAMAVSKIIVSPSDRKSLSSDHLDLVLHFDFVSLQ